MNWNGGLFSRIVIVVFAIFFTNFIIMQLICSNCGLLNSIIFTFIGLPLLVIGYLVFVKLQKTRFAKLLTKRNVNIICVMLVIILSPIVIVSGINSYYQTVPPSELTKIWIMNNGNNIMPKFAGMTLVYDHTYATKHGSFVINYSYGDYTTLDHSDFIWEYSKTTNELAIKKSKDWFQIDPTGWSLTLKIEIDTSKDPSIMTTYYINSTNFTFFNATLFDGATWYARDNFY